MAVFSGNGSESSPSFTFSSSTNTGIFRPDSSQIAVSTSGSERIRVNGSGALGLSGANYGSSFQFLMSNGSGSAPTWQDLTYVFDNSAPNVGINSATPKTTIASVTLTAGTWLLVGTWNGIHATGLGSVSDAQSFSINDSPSIAGWTNGFSKASYFANRASNSNQYACAASTLSLVVSIGSSTTYYLYGGPDSISSTLQCSLAGYLHAFRLG